MSYNNNYGSLALLLKPQKNSNMYQRKAVLVTVEQAYYVEP